MPPEKVRTHQNGMEAMTMSDQGFSSRCMKPTIRPLMVRSVNMITMPIVLSQKCTHLGCVVFYQADEDRWHCPCHEGNFETTTGNVISGPPTRPLGRIAVEVRGDTIWALGSQP